MHNLISDLVDCQAACNHCFNSCLEENDVKMMAHCIKLDRDCSEVCGAALTFVASESAFTKKILKLCAEICEACEKECSKHPYDHCRDCAKACRKCAEACRKHL